MEGIGGKVAPEGGDVLPLKVHDVNPICLYLCKEDAKQFSSLVFVLNKRNLLAGKNS